MSILQKSNENNSSVSADMFVKLDANESAIIMPLDDFPPSRYYEHSFSKGATFFTLIDTDTPDDPCKLIGSKRGIRYIMPVIVRNESEKAWSEPKYFKFKTQIYNAFIAIEQAFKDEGEGRTFKGSAIRVARVDTPGNFASYNAQFSGAKKYVLDEIPTHDLDMMKGIIPYDFEDVSEVKAKNLAKLIERGDTEFEGKTIIERLRDAGLVSGDGSTSWNDFKPPVVEDESDLPF